MKRIALLLVIVLALAGLAGAAVAQDAPERLVSADWLTENLSNPNVRVIEVSVVPGVFERGHIPGAVNFNWHTDLVDRVRRDIVSQADFETLARTAGISDDTTVVLYGDNNNWFAAYALWLFNYYGHDNVSLMDGGRKKWLAEGRPVTTDEPHFPPTSYRVGGINAVLRADRDFVRARLEQPSFALVDVRSPAEYVGDIIAPPGMSETAQRPGHIPGAKNVPWAQAVSEDGSFKSKEALAALYGGKGVGADAADIVAYCRIGERSSHTWFVLRHLLGYQNVRNYDGSWTEWGNLIGAPIRKGEQP